MRSRRTLLLVAAPAALLAAIAAMVVFSAQHSLTRARHSAAGSHKFAYTFHSFHPDATAANPGFEPVGSAPAFTAGVTLGGELYLAGPGGLAVYAPDGTLSRSLRTGLELPVAPIVAAATGRLRGSAEPQVLLATAGTGLLLLTPHGAAGPTVEQMLASEPGANDLTALLPLASGDLLLGTRAHGLLEFSGSSLAPVRFTVSGSVAGSDSARLEITALAAPDSTSWLAGTRSSGVFYSHGGTVAQATAAEGMPDNQVDSLAVAAGMAYAGTPLGIAQFNLAQPDLAQPDLAQPDLAQPDLAQSGQGAAGFRPVRTLAPGVFAHALALTPNGLAAGTLDQGVVEVALTPSTARLRHASITAPLEAADSTSARRIDAFLPRASAAAPLLALADGALFRRTGASWQPAPLAPVSPSESLTDRNISALAFTPAGELYVGFFDRGLDILDPDTGSRPRHFEDDHLFCVNRLLLDPARGTIAAATANGLVLFDAAGTPRQTLTRRDGLISDHISDLAFTPSGLALATPAGITFLGPAGTESLYAFQGLVNNHVYALAAQPGSTRLLAGTLGGLSMLDLTGSSQQVTRNLTVGNSGLAHNWITALAPEAPAASTHGENSFLVGTYGAGVERMSSAGVFSRIDLPAGAPRDLVINPNALLVTATHAYAGTLGHGLLVYTNASGRWSLVTAGLPSLNVTAFAARNGVLYVGTENGLVRIPEARL